MPDALWNLLSIAAGSLITWAVARHYYRRATDDLHNDLEALTGKLKKGISDLELMITAF